MAQGTDDWILVAIYITISIQEFFKEFVTTAFISNIGGVLALEEVCPL